MMMMLFAVELLLWNQHERQLQWKTKLFLVVSNDLVLLDVVVRAAAQFGNRRHNCSITAAEHDDPTTQW